MSINFTAETGKASAKSPLNADVLDAEIAAEARAKARPEEASSLHRPLHASGIHRRMSDAELMERMEQEEVSEFHVPIELIPEGMVYQWWTAEVYGQEARSTGSVLQSMRTGWQPVPADRPGLDGRWTPSGATGPIVFKGMQLMELPDAEAYNRMRMLYLTAKSKKDNSLTGLHSAPQGTGPRDHPLVRPRVNVTRGPMEVDS